MLFPVLGVVADALMRVGSLGMSPILLLIYRYLVVIVGGRWLHRGLVLTRCWLLLLIVLGYFLKAH